MVKKLKLASVIESLLLGAAIILFWRGVWNLADVYLYPSNDVISAGIGLFIGVVILYAFNFNLKALRP